MLAAEAIAIAVEYAQSVATVGQACLCGIGRCIAVIRTTRNYSCAARIHQGPSGFGRVIIREEGENDFGSTTDARTIINSRIRIVVACGFFGAP